MGTKNGEPNESVFHKDVARNILNFLTNDKETLDALNKLLAQDTKKLHFYLQKAFDGKQPCLIFELMQELPNLEGKKTLSVKNIFSIPLTSAGCVDLLHHILKDTKSDSKGFRLFGGEKTPDGIMQIRKLLEDKILTPAEKLHAVKGILEKGEPLTTKWIENFLKDTFGTRTEEVQNLYKGIVTLIDTLVEYERYRPSLKNC